MLFESPFCGGPVKKPIDRVCAAFPDLTWKQFRIESCYTGDLGLDSMIWDPSQRKLGVVDWSNFACGDPPTTSAAFLQKPPGLLTWWSVRMATPASRMASSSVPGSTIEWCRCGS